MQLTKNLYLMYLKFVAGNDSVYLKGSGGSPQVLNSDRSELFELQDRFLPLRSDL